MVALLTNPSALLPGTCPSGWPNSTTGFYEINNPHRTPQLVVLLTVLP